MIIIAICGGVALVGIAGIMTALRLFRLEERVTHLEWEARDAAMRKRLDV